MQEWKQTLLAEERNQHIIQTVKEYGKRLFSFIRKKVNTDADAEDILQDVWYQYTHSTETIEQVSGWLFRVARNKITDTYRKKKPQGFEEASFEREGEESALKHFLVSLESQPELEDIKKLFWEELFAALDELPENQRRVFILNELEDVTLQQIADAEKENLKTIISRKRYAVKHLRIRLQYLYDALNHY